MTVRDLCDELEEICPLALQESYDNCGLQVGNLGDEVKGCLLTLDVTEEVVSEAIDKGCNFILAHHPLIFRGIKRLTGANLVERTLMMAVRSGISIYAMHTNLDQHIHGVSARMAEVLGLTDIRPLSEVKYEGTTATSGFGAVGEIEPIPAADFIKVVKDKFDCKMIKATKNLDASRIIHRVALCTGSAFEFLSDAEREMADVYITADVKYHQFFEAQRTILLDIGHFESEQHTKDIFFDALSRKNHKFALIKSQVDTNPISYY